MTTFVKMDPITHKKTRLDPNDTLHFGTQDKGDKMTHKVTYDSDDNTPDFTGVARALAADKDFETAWAAINKALKRSYIRGYLNAQETDWWKAWEALENDHWKD